MEENTIVADNTSMEVATPSDTDNTVEVTQETEVQGNSVDTSQAVNETKAFSERLNAQVQKKIDEEYSRLYGAEYGIHSKADYEKAIAEQQKAEQNQQFQEQYGMDPNVIDERVKQLLENHPVVQSAKEQSRTLQLNSAAMDLSKVAKSLGINEEIKSWADVEKLPKYEAIKNSIVNNNLDIVTAAKLAYFDEVVNSTSTKAQQEAIAKVSANAASSPGSLVNHVSDETFFTKEQVQKMSKEEVRKNYEKICKSTPKW